MMDIGRPCNLTTSLKNRPTIWEASCVVLQGIKCAIFENLSITTKMLSCPNLVLGNPKTKYILIESQGLHGIGKGVYNPRLEVCPLAFSQIKQPSTNFLTSLTTF